MFKKDYFPTDAELRSHSRRDEIVEELKEVKPDHVVSIRFVKLEDVSEPWFQQIAALPIKDWRKGGYYWSYDDPKRLLELLS